MSEPHADAFASHPRFERTAEGVFEIDGLDFEAWVRLDEGAVVLVDEVPTLGATVVGETVASVVEDGWFETFERRVTDVSGVVDADVDDPVVNRDGDRVRVETRIPVEDGGDPSVAIAAANYIEGTWVEGIIPGYEYDDRVQAIRNRARQNASDGP
jgi:hypothetical protein